MIAGEICWWWWKNRDVDGDRGVFFSGIEEIFVISFVSISVECNECGRL